MEYPLQSRGRKKVQISKACRLWRSVSSSCRCCSRFPVQIFERFLSCSQGIDREGAGVDIAGACQIAELGVRIQLGWEISQSSETFDFRKDRAVHKVTQTEVTKLRVTKLIDDYVSLTIDLERAIQRRMRGQPTGCMSPCRTEGVLECKNSTPSTRPKT